jgi:hypothetical protein
MEDEWGNTLVDEDGQDISLEETTASAQKEYDTCGTLCGDDGIEMFIKGAIWMWSRYHT